MKARRKARRFALDVLYEAEIRDMLPLEAFDERQRLGWDVERDDPVPPVVADEPDAEVLDFARTLVANVQSHHADVDAVITRYADKWAIERMPVIDRSLIRMALCELLWESDVPVAVAINEAVELAKSLSTEDSGRFVNGLLGRIVEQELDATPD